MSMNSLINHIQINFQNLSRIWKNSSYLWNDLVRWQFEREYWEPLEGKMKPTIVEMENLAQVISKAKQNVN